MLINIIAGVAQAEKASIPPIKVKNVEFLGNTVFTDAQLQQAITPFPKQKVSLERLLQVRTEITNYYNKRGYIASGAFIPPQNFNNGQIIIRVIEGKLEEIVFEKQPFISKKYIMARLPPVNRVFNLKSLATSLERLYDDPFINKINVSITETEVGKVRLNLKLKEKSRSTWQLAVANSYAKSIGEIGSQASLKLHTLGYGDILDLSLTKTQGLDQFSGSYSIPLNYSNTKLSFSYVNAQSQFIEDDLADVNIEGDFDSYLIELQQPLIIDNRQRFDFKAKFNLLRSETFILDDFSFSFVEGVEDGQSRISELSLEQQYSNRSSNTVTTLNSSFNIGVNIFEPTITTQGRDGLYWNWQFQGQRAYKINERFILVSNLEIQLSPDQLLPSKQFSLGGNDSIRGYQKNLLIGDNGLALSNELQISLLKTEQSELKAITFFEGGTTWNNSDENTEKRDLLSTGLGIQYFFKDIFTIRVDYGIPLVSVEDVSPDSSTSRTDFLFLFSP
ncbi:MAG: ShlB/FhaC/HecB family hemolysin secretion/activation protein [Waterburya sp.]